VKWDETRTVQTEGMHVGMCHTFDTLPHRLLHRMVRLGAPLGFEDGFASIQKRRQCKANPDGKDQ
jgi:hypothetical protein